MEQDKNHFFTDVITDAKKSDPFNFLRSKMNLMQKMVSNWLASVNNQTERRVQRKMKNQPK